MAVLSEDRATLVDRAREALDGFTRHLRCPHADSICRACARPLPDQLGHLAWKVLGRPALPRSNEAAKVLADLEGKARGLLDALDGFGAIDHYLPLEEDWRRSREREDLRRLVDLLALARDHMSEEVDVTGTGRGGRTVDDRIAVAVNALSVIYADATGTGPTHVQDPQTGEPTSPFDRFVEAFFSAFYPEEAIPWAAIRERTRTTVASILESDDSPPGPPDRHSDTSEGRS